MDQTLEESRQLNALFDHMMNERVLQRENLYSQSLDDNVTRSMNCCSNMEIDWTGNFFHQFFFHYCYLF
jgi:hypothetical protein